VPSKIKVAIAGVGFGEKYAIGLKAQPDVEIAGVFSRRPERAAAMAAKFDIPFSTHRFRDLLDLPGLDVLAVVTPNSTHAEYVHAALRAGLHVICDKPLGIDTRQAQEMLLAAQRARVKHVTFVPYRFSPAAVAMKRAVRNEQLGRIISVRATWAVDMRGEPLRWRFQRKLSGAGVVVDLGAHIFDLLLWWLGPIRRVLGRCRTLVPERPAEVGGRSVQVDVPDECWALLEFPQQGVGCVSLSWNAQRDQQVEVEGTRGRLVYQSPSLLQWLSGRGPFNPTVTLTPTAAPGRTTQIPLPEDASFTTADDALARMFRDIVAYLRGAEKPASVATFEDGVRALQIADAIEESDASGTWVDL